MPPSATAEPIWVLLGSRQGDNKQLLAVADGLDRPYRALQLQFGPLAALPPAMLMLARRPISWRCETPVEPPWPRLVLAAGRKSAPAALWIKRQSAGKTLLVHVNRPWAPLGRFDLIVTTPQYSLASRANVRCNLLPFQLPLAAAGGARVPEHLVDLSQMMRRPWTLVLVGGPSRPFLFDDADAAALARVVNDECKRHGGSVWVLGSPRTPQRVLDALRQRIEVTSHIVPWARGEPPYAGLWGQADRFIVTSDSASMIADALSSGRPVVPFPLTAHPDWRIALATAWRRMALRHPSSMAARSFDFMTDAGLLSSTRDLGRFQGMLHEAGLFDDPEAALRRAACERTETLARISALMNDAAAKARKPR